jgi:triosephosphate isomerase
MRRLIAITSWKMNVGVAESVSYAREFQKQISHVDVSGIDISVLPPFTSLHATAHEFKKTPISTGGQNMHWEDSGNWTGEISASMLTELGCQYVEVGHSERLQYFGETYDFVRLKVDTAIRKGLIPIICLGETAREKDAGCSDEVLLAQVLTSLCGQPDDRIPELILAYEPRWAIGAATAASPDYVEDRHRALRNILKEHRGQDVAARTRIIYGGSVTPENGRDIISIDDVDGLFVGRAAWKPEGFAKIVALVSEAAAQKKQLADVKECPEPEGRIK